jgi:hypothetical protein
MIALKTETKEPMKAVWKEEQLMNNKPEKREEILSMRILLFVVVKTSFIQYWMQWNMKFKEQIMKY